ncbi:hypothetical protein HAX54_016522 [Datura stramonium]|uniref:Uncharacterized protein n=1 Tax=Datura stramonium TaxID=4076 RepID=A0ABS8S0B7_DATST|nr:hypothetical protein [Datura stramonium]
MGENYLNGSIPKGILGQISLSNNRLTGPLPPSIGNFAGVQKLLLDGNKFSGRIPAEIGKLQQLSKIDFSHNNFSGPIAPEISQCKLLTYVDLSRNQLSGEIPTEITDLCGPYLGPCKEGVVDGVSQPHQRGALSPSMKLLLVIGLLVCSIVFAVAAIIKARSLKKASEARAWKLTAFQRLEFTCDDILDSLKEDSIIWKRRCWYSLQGDCGRIRHRHIVRLAKFCSNHETNLLVYEYMLMEVLKCFMAERRYYIGIQAQVADFGLAKFLQDSGTSECMSAIAGSYALHCSRYKSGDSAVTDQSPPPSASALESPTSIPGDTKDHHQPTPQSSPPDLLSI